MLLTWWLGVLMLAGLATTAALLLSHPDRPASSVVHLIGPVGGPAVLVGATILACAVYRQILRPKHRLIGLRAGPDELRLGPVLLAIGLTMATGMSPLVLPGKLELAATALLLLVSPFVSLVAPAIFALRRLDPRPGWRLVKGRYFDLLGMNLLTWGVYATASVLFGQMWRWLILLNDDGLNRAMRAGTTGFAWPAGIAVVLAVLIYGALLVIVTAPSAEAYRRLTSPPAPGP